MCKTLRLSDQDVDKIISLLPIEPKKKTVVMFCDDVKLVNFTELLSCFDITGENVSININTNVDELCMIYICISFKNDDTSIITVILCF